MFRRVAHSLGVRDGLLLCACLFALTITIVYPSLRLLARAILDWRMEVLLDGPGRAAVINTIVLSFASVATAGIVGTTMAFVLTRYAFPGRSVLAGLAYLPLTLPPLVGVVAFYYVIGRDGFISLFFERMLGLERFYPRGAIAILIIHTYSFYVFFYAMVGAALESMDRSQIEAARTLGASPMRVFFRVTVPLLRPPLVGAALLTFMSSGASFSAPLIFGEDFPMLSVRIYEETTQFNEAAALTLTVALAAISLLGIFLFRSGARVRGAASKGVRVPMRSGPAKLLAGLGALACMGVLLTPHLAIVFLSFVRHELWYAELIPRAFTLDNYRVIMQDPRAFAPIRNSVFMSAIAAGAALLVGLPAAYLIGRGRPGGRMVNLLVMIPWALPGTVIAMNLLVAFNDPWLPRQTIIWLLPLAYFVRNIPLLTRMATAAIEPFDATLIEAGRCHGMSPFGCFLRIVLPLLGPALIAATALVFATSLGEFVASILLYRPTNIPIAVMINMQLRGSGIGSAFAYSVLLIIIVAASFLLVRRWSSRML